MAFIKLLKMIAILFASIVGASYAIAGPHGHHHLHIRDGAAAVVTHVVTVPVKMFEYQGQLVPEVEVCQGIMNGTLYWAPGSENTPDCVNFVAASTGAKSTPSTPAANVVTVTVTRTNTPAAVLTTSTSVPPVTMTHILTPAALSVSSPIVDKPINPSALTTLRSITTSVLAVSTPSNKDGTSKTPVPLSSSIQSHSTKAAATSSATTSSAIASASAVHSVGSGNSFIQSNTNVDVEFPDGQIDCSEFPDAYGAIHIPWMNLGGWTGIQFAEISESMVMGLSTGVVGNECTDGNGGSTTFCSYACPPGYQKSQWPTTQGNSSMAVSVGGLKCENGKLHLTNPDLSTSLCIPGTGKSFVNNKLNGTASICRTDYPGKSKKLK
jgi:Beta-glucosidase (SUN family)